MADAKLTALTAASALAGEDLFYISQDGVSKSATHTQLLTLVGTEYVAKAGDTMTGALTLPAGAVGAPSLMFTGSAATTGIYTPAADQVAISISGTRRFMVSASNGVSLTNTTIDNSGNIASGGSYIKQGSTAYVGWTGSADPTSAVTLSLYEDASDVLAQRRSTNAQTLRVYGTYTDSSNYERLSLSTTAGSGVTIAAETLGTGANNLDITLTPTGTGKVKFPSGSVDQFGNIVASSFYHSGSTMAFYSPGVRTRDTGEIAWSSTTTVAGSVDVAMHRASAGVLAIDNGTAGTYRDLLVRNVKTDPVAFASLVAAATAGTGARAMITNCSHATFGTAADGGGSTKVPVYSDGASWLVG